MNKQLLLLIHLFIHCRDSKEQHISEVKIYHQQLSHFLWKRGDRDPSFHLRTENARETLHNYRSYIYQTLFSEMYANPCKALAWVVFPYKSFWETLKSEEYLGFWSRKEGVYEKWWTYKWKMECTVLILIFSLVLLKKKKNRFYCCLCRSLI